MLELPYLDITEEASGHLRFIAVTGDIDGRHLEREGRPGVEFSWVGMDESDGTSGRAWAIVEANDTLSGHISVHAGEDSAFGAARRGRRPKRRVATQFRKRSRQ